MSKFPSAFSEELYQDTPDEEHGSSGDGIGWAGMYRMDGARDKRLSYGAAWIVLVEGTDGLVECFRCSSETQARLLASSYDC